jgi:hypothetical protein
MTDVIQCPSCSKRFKLPASPPAVFTCTACGAAMDLSAFGGTAPPPPEPEAPEPRSRARGGARGGGRGARTAPAGRRSARSRAAAVEEEPEQSPRMRAAARRKSNAPLVAGGVFIGLALIAVIIAVATRDDPPPVRPETDLASRPSSTSGSTPSGTSVPTSTAPSSTGTGTGPAPATGPAGAAGNGAEAPVVAPRPQYLASQAEIKVHPHLPETSVEDQNAINEAVANVIRGAREGREASEWLVKKGMPAAPRLISEFKHIIDRVGLDGPNGMSQAMAIDLVLRKIDGVQERKFNDHRPIHIRSDPTEAMNTIKRWNWWWDQKQYLDPQRPWDPAVDETDDAGEGTGGGDSGGTPD